MAAPSTFTPTKEGQANAEPGKPASRPHAEPQQEQTDQGTERGRPTGLLTAAAVVLAFGLGLTTVLLGNSIFPQGLSTLNLAVFMAISTVVAFVGVLPMRWGWYVVPAVTTAFYALGIYNLANTGNTVFAFVSGEALGYAVIGPGSGVVLGYVLQLVYSFVAGE